MLRENKIHSSPRTNFNLIQTYIPLFLCIARGIVFIFVFKQLTIVDVSFRSVIVLSFLSVFVDHYMFMLDTFNQNVGYLYCVFAALILDEFIRRVNPKECEKTSYVLTTIVVDIVWAFVSNLFLLNLSLNFFTTTRPYSMISIFLFGLHAVMMCFTGETWQFMCRLLPFYLCAFLIYHVSALTDFKTDKENRNQNRDHYQLGLYVSLHFLFVQDYVLLGSIFVSTVVFWHIIWGDRALTTFVRTAPSKAPEQFKTQELYTFPDHTIVQTEVANEISKELRESDDVLIEQLKQAKKMLNR